MVATALCVRRPPSAYEPLPLTLAACEKDATLRSRAALITALCMDMHV
jgi:hypothetical protein